ncbi:hypothetical protein QUQ58_004745 [Escherichia coli]|nr:hypothetical protein [Escherichia coli]
MSEMKLIQTCYNEKIFCPYKNLSLPEQKIEMTWGEFWLEVKARDGKISEPETENEIRQRILDAASELFWDVFFIGNRGIKLNDGEGEYIFRQYSFRENAWLAINMLRREVCYIAHECPDALDEWSEVGINSLTEWYHK